MAIIAGSLFGWQEVNAKSDLKRLELVLKNLPDEELMRHLEGERDKGRDDYPLRAIWNSVIAGIVYEHVSIESLRRELKRNGELRQACGFDVFKGATGVPSASAYTRFLKKLMKHGKYVQEIFESLVEELKELLPDYGEELAIDSKKLESYGNGNKDKGAKKGKDGRRDVDADWGIKKIRQEKEGKVWEKISSWFGYKVHLIVDSKHELPISYKVTRASRSDSPELLKMVEELENKHEEIVKRARRLRGDRGYDSKENNAKLWDDYRIKPIIDIRHMWKDKEETRPLYEDKVDNIVYDEGGKIYCHCPVEGSRKEMAYMGYEHKRKSLKYRCPAQSYGYECRGKDSCDKGRSEYGRTLRIPLSRDRRMFVPVARSSYAWKRAYRQRTAVERVNSRLDVSFGFERHFIRGMKKMNLRVGLAMLVMNALAVGHIKEKRQKQMRSLVSSWN